MPSVLATQLTMRADTAVLPIASESPVMRVCLLCCEGRLAHPAELQVADLICTQGDGLHTTGSRFECLLTFEHQQVLLCS